MGTIKYIKFHFTWSSSERVETNFLFFTDSKQQLVCIVANRLPASNDANFAWIDYLRMKRRAEDIDAIPHHTDVEYTNFLWSVNASQQPTIFSHHLKFANAIRSVNLIKRIIFYFILCSNNECCAKRDNYLNSRFTN